MCHRAPGAVRVRLAIQATSTHIVGAAIGAMLAAAAVVWLS